MVIEHANRRPVTRGRLLIEATVVPIAVGPSNSTLKTTRRVDSGHRELPGIVVSHRVRPVRPASAGVEVESVQDTLPAECQSGDSGVPFGFVEGRVETWVLSIGNDQNLC